MLAQAEAVSRAAEALAELDVCRRSQNSLDEPVRPEIYDDHRFFVKAGRHPVVEASLSGQGDGSFIANDCHIHADDEQGNTGRLLLLTGPNMAGNQPICAKCWIAGYWQGYVPATKAEIGIVDRLFSRVGAADDLARGQSTFMVEMVETAAILNQARLRAWSFLTKLGVVRQHLTVSRLPGNKRYMHEVNNAELCLPHYHELTGLSEKLDKVTNITMRVAEYQR